MRFLLDTHIWLWAERGSPELAPRVVNLLADPRHELWLAPISAWELILLVEKGRITLDRPTEAWIKTYSGGNRYRAADMNFGVITAACSIVLAHADPADRLLAATARHYELTLVTADTHLLRGKGFERLANR